MFCLECKERATCDKICASLERELSRFECYQRELVVSIEELLYVEEKEDNLDHYLSKISLNPDLLYQLIMRLEYEEEMVIELYFYEGLTFAHIGNLLNMSASTALRHCQSGLKKLKKLILDEIVIQDSKNSENP